MKKIIYSIVFILGFLSARAQNSPELKNLINQSFTYYPRLQELNESVTISEQRVDLAATALKPTVSASGNYTYVAPVPKIPFPDGNGNLKTVQFQPNHNFNTGINIFEPIYDFGKTKLTIERARLDVQQAKTNVELNKSELAAQVANIYYTVIYLQKAITVQDSVIAVLEVNRKQMEQKFKNGEALKLDVLTMQNNIDIEQNAKIELQNSLQKQFELLRYATGKTITTPVAELQFNLDFLDDSLALQSARNSNPQYQMANLRIRGAETELAISRTQNKPVINLNGSTGFRNGFQPDIAAFKFNYALGVGVSVPLYTGGRNRKQVQIAQSGVRQSQLSLETLDNEFRKNIELAMTDIRTNEMRLRTVDEQISIAREALRVAQSRYSNGISTNVELLNANNNLQRIELSRIRYQYQLALAKIELARLSGMRYW